MISVVSHAEYARVRIALESMCISVAAFAVSRSQPPEDWGFVTFNTAIGALGWSFVWNDGEAKMCDETGEEVSLR